MKLWFGRERGLSKSRACVFLEKRGQVALHVIGGRGVTLDNSLCSMMASGFSKFTGYLKVTMGSLDIKETVEVTGQDIEVHRAACGGFCSEVRVGEKYRPVVFWAIYNLQSVEKI